MKKAVKLLINGTVQGIFFRQYIKEQAEKNNVKGFVRNLQDGRVEAFLEGNSDEVDKMISIAERGPQHAQIRNVEQKEEKFQGLKDFKILRI